MLRVKDQIIVSLIVSCRNEGRGGGEGGINNTSSREVTSMRRAHARARELRRFQAVHETRWQSSLPPPSSNDDDDDDYGAGWMERGEGGGWRVLAAGVSRALRSAFDSLYNNMTEMSVN